MKHRLNAIRAWLARLGGLFGNERRERELSAELESHLQMHIDDNVRAGMTLEEARRQALIQLGGVEQTKENYRNRRGLPWLESLLQDIRFALHMLRKTPGFTAVAVATLALGVGMNSAVFSIVDAVLLRSLPFHDANQLVAISETHPSMPEIGASVGDFEDWEKQSHAFIALAAYDPINFAHTTLLLHGEPADVQGTIASHNLFSLLGIAPVLGRNFLPDEDALGKSSVAILSNETWKTEFNADPHILGQPIILNQKRYTVIGILPPGIRFAQSTDVWLPLGELDNADRTSRFYHPLFVIARLKSGVSVSAARAEMNGIADRLAAAYPQTNHQIGVDLRPLLQMYVGGLRMYLLVLWVAVGLVLLIACANVASLLLARGETRQQEMAVRRALGATRFRLIRQVITESIVLSAIGSSLGLFLAYLGTLLISRWLPKILDAPILRLHDIRTNLVVVGMTLIVSVVSAAIFGVLPAVRAGQIQTALRSGQRTYRSADRRTVHRVLVTVEVALAVVILISTGLLVHSLQQLIATSPGFRADHLLTLRVALPNNEYESKQDVDLFYQRLLPKLLALPGVEDVGTIDQTPLVPNLGVTRFLVDGSAPVRPGDYPVANYRLVSPGYFQTMDVPLLTGRAIAENDLARSDPVIVINHTLAEEFFAGQDPIGRKLLLGVATGKPRPVPIVGVVGDVRDIAIDSPPRAEMYFAGFSQVSTVVVRSGNASTSLVESIRAAVLGVDPSQSIFGVQTGDQLVSQSMARQRFSTALLALFSTIALVLAAVGIYGVTSYAVAERTHEIGVRMALGAAPSNVLGLILREEMVAPLVGLAIGIASAGGAATLVSHLLYRVGARDPVTYASVCVVLLGAALLACYIPARRAMRVDPMVALRYE